MASFCFVSFHILRLLFGVFLPCTFNIVNPSPSSPPFSGHPVPCRYLASASPSRHSAVSYKLVLFEDSPDLLIACLALVSRSSSFCLASLMYQKNLCYYIGVNSVFLLHFFFF